MIPGGCGTARRRTDTKGQAQTAARRRLAALVGADRRATRPPAGTCNACWLYAHGEQCERPASCTCAVCHGNRIEVTA